MPVIFSDLSGSILNLGQQIDVWGDSLSNGTYLSRLATLTGRTVNNKAVGSQTSNHIAARMGALAPKLTIADDQIVAGANTVTHIDGVAIVDMASIGSNDMQFLSSVGENTSRSVTGTAGSVHCTLARSASGGPPSTSETYTITPDGGEVLPASFPAGTPFIVDNATTGNIQVLWPGRNDYFYPDQVKANVAAMVKRIGHTRFVVMPVINGEFASEYAGASGYLQIFGLEQDLAAAYPGNFLNIRRLLIDRGLSDAGITPTSQDNTDLGHDIVPASLRADAVHLVTASYNLVADYLNTFIRAKGWL